MCLGTLQEYVLAVAIFPKEELGMFRHILNICYSLAKASLSRNF